MCAEICPLGQLDKLFAEILALEHAEKGGWRFFDTFGDRLAPFKLT